jgi:hypothetical protein
MRIGVCDVFDGICCARRCYVETEYCDAAGACRVVAVLPAARGGTGVRTRCFRSV